MLKDESTKMTLKVATGTSDTGKTISANRTLSNINPELTDTVFCTVAAGAASLVADPLMNVSRIDTKVFEIDD